MYCCFDLSHIYISKMVEWVNWLEVFILPEANSKKKKKRKEKEKENHYSEIEIVWVIAHCPVGKGTFLCSRSIYVKWLLFHEGCGWSKQMMWVRALLLWVLTGRKKRKVKRKEIMMYWENCPRLFSPINFELCRERGGRGRYQVCLPEALWFQFIALGST